jgi:Flp pilus assembly pilin Flp
VSEGVRIQAAPADGGASAVEYTTLVAAIAAVIILVVFAVGTFSKQSYAETCTNFKTQASAVVQAQANCA